jgi:hypothetical protein
MAGTRLTLVVSSDTASRWGGHLGLPQNEAPRAKLSGRGFTYIFPQPGSAVKIPTYKDSCLDAAGTGATVQDFADAWTIGLAFDNDVRPYLTGGGHPAYPGDWFVVDYYAEQAGDCSVRLYANGPVGPIVGPWVEPDVGPLTLLQTLSFTHVPSRDFNGDAVVDFRDFARFAAHWRCPVDPKSDSDATFDFKTDGQVDLPDLASFCNYWLARTDSNEPPIKP